MQHIDGHRFNRCDAKGGARVPIKQRISVLAESLPYRSPEQNSVGLTQAEIQVVKSCPNVQQTCTRLKSVALAQTQSWEVLV